MSNQTDLTDPPKTDDKPPTDEPAAQEAEAAPAPVLAEPDESFKPKKGQSLVLQYLQAPNGVKRCPAKVLRVHPDGRRVDLMAKMPRPDGGTTDQEYFGVEPCAHAKHVTSYLVTIKPKPTKKG